MIIFLISFFTTLSLFSFCIYYNSVKDIYQNNDINEFLLSSVLDEYENDNNNENNDNDNNDNNENNENNENDNNDNDNYYYNNENENNNYYYNYDN